MSLATFILDFLSIPFYNLLILIGNWLLFMSKNERPSKSVYPIHSSSTSLDNLPDEILVRVFTYVHILDRLRYRRINRRWNRLIPISITEFRFSVWTFEKYGISLSSTIFYNINNARAYDRFCFLLKIIGPRLSKLFVDGELERKWSNYTRELEKESRPPTKQHYIQLIIDHCPRLTSLTIIPLSSIIFFDRLITESFEQIFLLFLKRLGHQLTHFQYDRRYTNFISNPNDYLNPQVLRQLQTSLLSDVSQLAIICERFSLLNELTCHIYYEEIQYLKHLKHLKHLRTLVVSASYKTTNHEIKLKSLAPIDLDLHTLSLSSRLESQIPMFVRRLSSLKNLTVCLQDNSEYRFAFTLAFMPHLKRLKLQIESDCFSELFPHLFSMKLLNKFYINAINLNWLKLSEMPLMSSVTELEILVKKRDSFDETTIKRWWEQMPQVFPNLQTWSTNLIPNYFYEEAVFSVSHDLSWIKFMSEMNQLRILILHKNSNRGNLLRPVLTHICQRNRVRIFRTY